MVICPQFNSFCDIGEVEPYHFIDLKRVLQSGSLPAGSATTSVHNGLDSTAQIGSRVKDNFDVYDAAKVVNTRLVNQSKAKDE